MNSTDWTKYIPIRSLILGSLLALGLGVTELQASERVAGGNAPAQRKEPRPLEARSSPVGSWDFVIVEGRFGR